MNTTRALSFVLLVLAVITCTHAQPPRRVGRGTNRLKPRDQPRSRRACRAERVRLLSGRCTNPTVEYWGQAQFPQFSYDQPRSSETIDDGGLRSARDISNIVFDQSTQTTNSHGLNLLFVFFGQFLDHNYAATPELEEEEIEIHVPASDPVITDRTSLPFKRSERALLSDGQTFRPINSLPSALDLSAVYGPDEERNLALREVGTGKLKTSPGDFLPVNTEGFFNAPDTSANFFFAGDHRPSEHPALTAMHTIFLREHNRLVDEINSRGVNLSPEDVYQAARFINIGQFQKIVLEEFYPAIAGQDLPPYRFERSVDPTLSDVFAGAAFRIGHTMVSNELPQNNGQSVLAPIPMVDVFFAPASTFTTERLENTLRGISQSLAEEVDTKIVNLLRNQLFEHVPNVEGFDLVALNLQRGRDHALPRYNEVRATFGLPTKASFNDITSDADLAARLSTAYNGRVDDVEIFVGLLAEDRVSGSGFGELMGAIWEREFTRLRNGDQFFFELQRNSAAVVTGRLTDLVRDLQRPGSVSLRDIIVRNTAVTAAELPGHNIFKA